jgi:hypothetical protein
MFFSRYLIKSLYDASHLRPIKSVLKDSMSMKIYKYNFIRENFPDEINHALKDDFWKLYQTELDIIKDEHNENLNVYGNLGVFIHQNRTIDKILLINKDNFKYSNELVLAINLDEMKERYSYNYKNSI